MPVEIVNTAEDFLVPGWIVGRVPPHRLTGTFILKAALELVPGGIARPAPEPALLDDEIFEEDEETSSLRYPGDYAFFKPKADLLLVGDAVPRENARPR
jgi:hypothetical protein